MVSFTPFFGSSVNRWGFNSMLALGLQAAQYLQDMQNDMRRMTEASDLETSTSRATLVRSCAPLLHIPFVS